jgi:hypothetical protein
MSLKEVWREMKIGGSGSWFTDVTCGSPFKAYWLRDAPTSLTQTIVRSAYIAFL